MFREEDKIIAFFNSNALARHFLAGQQWSEQRAYGMCTIMSPQQYLALLNAKFPKRKTK